jgi:D-erythro-7,8-dihydroneopterin triphosphate epimerase
MKRMQIHIKNLRLRAIVGIFEWERNHPQDVILNVYLDFDATDCIAHDSIDDTVDYKALKKQIIQEVQKSEFYLVEKLAAHVLELVMARERVLEATVEIDKPHALRFADSVSVRISDRKE